MSQDSNREQDHRQDFVDSMLQSLHQDSALKSQALVTEMLPRLDENLQIESVQDSRSKKIGRVWSPRWVTIGLATAALFLVTLSLSLLDETRTASAAVKRSLDQSLLDVGRHYLVDSDVRLENGDSVTIQSDLYVRGGDQFAWRIRLLRDKDLWFGSNRGQAWVVPNVGPVLEGGSQSLVDWALGRENFSGPFLHISGLLKKLRDDYELEFQDPLETSTSSNLGACDHIVGIHRQPDANLAPGRVQLWADMRTGVAIKVIQSWDLPDDSAGWRSITTELVNETSLSDAFFTADAHGGDGRIRINFNKGLRQSK